MDSALKSELNSCIAELRSISNDLDDVSAELKRAIIGMSLFKYTWTLENCAGRYRSAANRLSRIR